MSREVRRGVYILPSILTIGNLFCGFYAIIAIYKDDLSKAVLAIIIALVVDFLDGAVAKEQHDAVDALIVLEHRRDRHVDDDVLGQTLLDSVFALDDGAPAGEYSARQLRDRVIVSQQPLDRATRGGLRRGFEDATGGRVHQLDLAGFVEYEDPGENGVEYTAEVPCHGYAARGSSEKKFRVRSWI